MKKRTYRGKTWRLVDRVCTDLIWASWLDSVSPKAKREIAKAVSRLAHHFNIELHKSRVRELEEKQT